MTEYDHDTMLQMKAEIDTHTKDIYNITQKLKDLHDENYQMAKRMSAMELQAAVFDSCLGLVKENNVVKKQDLKETAIDLKERFLGVYEDMRVKFVAVYDFIKTEDKETREELRRTIINVGAMVGLVSGSVGTVIGILIGLYLG